MGMLSIRRVGQQSHGRRRNASASTRAQRPQVEGLEARCLLSTFANVSDRVRTAAPAVHARSFAHRPRGGAPAFNSANWMGDNEAALAPLRLAQFTMPGSHDAAMSRVHGIPLDFFPAVGNAKTQSSGIFGQLEAGVRYFDLRPLYTLFVNTSILGETLFRFEAYSFYHGDVNLGIKRIIPTGESLESVLTGIHHFMEQHPKEIIFLNLQSFNAVEVAHSPLNLNLLDNPTSLRWGDDQTFLLMHMINSKLGPWLLDASKVVGPHGDLSTATLQQLWNPNASSGGTVGKVVLLTPNPGGAGNVPVVQKVDLGQTSTSLPYLPLYDSYTGNTDVNTVITDQLSKFKGVLNQYPSYRQGNSGDFLLNWTLTPRDGAAGVFLDPSVENLAKKINPLLYDKVTSDFVVNGMAPNILNLDFVNSFNNRAAEAALKLDLQAAGQPTP
jgi:hypothetical protein